MADDSQSSIRAKVDRKPSPTIPVTRSIVDRRGRPFTKGRSGNPAGRPKGSRNQATIVAQSVFDGQAEALIQKVVQLALEGDLSCLKICVQRLVPPRKDAPIDLSVPEIGALADIPRFFEALTAALGKGGITPSEAGILIDLVEVLHKLLEVGEVEPRIRALEKKANSLPS